LENSQILFPYRDTGLKITTPPTPEPESAVYSAHRYALNGKNIVFRTGKTTSKKQGQFVTLWKRPHQDTMPLQSTDPIEFVIIHVEEPPHSGQFIFNKDTLIKQGIITHETKPGKRGFRVYPPWTYPTSKQALKTQAWQLTHFVDFSTPDWKQHLKEHIR